jgi:hypothetical protein
VFTPQRLVSYCLRLEVLLGALLPCHSSPSDPAAPESTHVFAERAYNLVQQVESRNRDPNHLHGGAGFATKASSSSSSSSLSWGSGGSVQLLHLAAVWHAIMRARARRYDSYQER